MNELRHVLSELVVERVGFGIFVLDRDLNVVMWNRFMQDHSGKTAEQVIGKPIFMSFPELPRVWLTRKVESVFQLGSFAFSSWEQRPYLFKFDHDRPITGGVDFMQQDCTFMPLTREREVMAVCVTISDVTHASMMQRARDEAVAKLQEYADRDGLTGIANRRYFELRLADEFARCSCSISTISSASTTNSAIWSAIRCCA
jgi:PAS domain-containing protein